MSDKFFSLALGALLWALGSLADAQQQAKVPRIGYLGTASASANLVRIEAFRQGLRELGYVEGASSLSTGGQRENSIAYPRSRLS